MRLWLANRHLSVWTNRKSRKNRLNLSTMATRSPRHMTQASIRTRVIQVHQVRARSNSEDINLRTSSDIRIRNQWCRTGLTLLWMTHLIKWMSESLLKVQSLWKFWTKVTCNLFQVRRNSWLQVASILSTNLYQSFHNKKVITRFTKRPIFLMKKALSISDIASHANIWTFQIQRSKEQLWVQIITARFPRRRGKTNPLSTLKPLRNQSTRRLDKIRSRESSRIIRLWQR